MLLEGPALKAAAASAFRSTSILRSIFAERCAGVGLILYRGGGTLSAAKLVCTATSIAAGAEGKRGE